MGAATGEEGRTPSPRPRRSFLSPFFTPFLGIATLLFLTFLLASWWSSRTDTLFGTGRWLAGKDTGKYVFYTYDFLFRPLADGVTLTGDMGFQEILLRDPEGPRRALEAVGGSAWIGKDSYLWVELRRERQAGLGLRFSRKKGLPDGSTWFDPEGEILEDRPWTGGVPGLTDGWHRFEASLGDGLWTVTLDGHRVGSVPDRGERSGRLGFRGSGPLGGRVRVRDVSTAWIDPVSGRRWNEDDRLASRRFPGRGWAVAAAVAFGFLVLRWLAGRVLLGAADPDRRSRAAAARQVSLALLLGVVVLAPGARPGLAVPVAVAASCLADLVILGWAGGKGRERGGTREPLLLALVIGALWLLALGAMVRHGNVLLRGESPGPPMLRGVHPDRYRLFPLDDGNSAEFTSDGPVTLEPGQPLFTGMRLFGEQVIEADVDLPPEGALDLAFQLRSFATVGDPDGEKLPYARRLLRLSADPRAPGGLSRMTGARPAPFSHLVSKPAPGATRIRVVVDGRGVTADVNGATSEFPRVGSLGRGETGLMAWGAPVTVRSLRVVPLEGAGSAWPGLALGLQLLAGLVVIAMVGALALRGPEEASPAPMTVLAALFPTGLYLLGALALSPGDLAFVGRQRVLWLDILLMASILEAGGAVLLLRNRLRWPAAAFNLLAMLALAVAALVAWDLLPDNHALRLRYSRETVVPAGKVRLDRGRARPWFADMTSIGASTFIWKQSLGGEPISREKPAGEVRIFVVGGSQAWGSGAASSGETFAALLEGRLRARGLPAMVWNAGVNGAGTQQVSATYLGVLRQFRPDVVVADLGVNDATALFGAGDAGERSRAMTASMAEMAAACRADGTDLLLVREPLSLETALRPVEAHETAMAEIVRREGFEVVDPRPLMAREETRGLVWWDTAHLTPRGQRLMAAFLEEPVAALVSRRIGGAPTP